MHAVQLNHIVRHAFEHRLDHHLEHHPRERGADASVRPEPERDVAVGCPVEHHLVGSLELPLVVVGREPADEHLVVAPKLLAAKDGVAAHRAAQRLVHRAIPEILVARRLVELGTIDELLPQIPVGAEVKQAQCGQ